MDKSEKNVFGFRGVTDSFLCALCPSTTTIHFMFPQQQRQGVLLLLFFFLSLSLTCLWWYIAKMCWCELQMPKTGSHNSSQNSLKWTMHTSTTRSPCKKVLLILCKSCYIKFTWLHGNSWDLQLELCVREKTGWLIWRVGAWLFH